MDLLKTILIYMSMVFVSSVQTAPEAAIIAEVTASPEVAIVETVVPATETPPPTATPTPVPTPAITPNAEYKTLKVGDKNDDVKEMQRRLAELGYYTGDIDGSYGNQTRRAVEKFQYNHGLSSDGIAGKRTLTVLYESPDIVLAPTQAPEDTDTPAPGTSPAASPAASQPTAALTSKPEASTSVPTFMPTPTPGPDSNVVAVVDATGITEPSAEPETEPSADSTSEPETEPSQTPAPAVAEAMEGYQFLVNGQPVTAQAEGEEPTPIVPLKKGENMVLAPLINLLESGGLMVLPDISETGGTYAFAMGEDLYQAVYELSADEKVTSLNLTRAFESLAASLDKMEWVDGILYLSTQDIEVWTGITFALDEEAKAYTVTFPTVSTEAQ